MVSRRRGGDPPRGGVTDGYFGNECASTQLKRGMGNNNEGQHPDAKRCDREHNIKQPGVKEH